MTKTKPAAGIAKPPNRPPTAIGTQPQGVPPRRPSSSRGLVVAVSGPERGVGKTTVCLNLALAWAGTQKRSVLVVPLDPDCPSDNQKQLGLEPPSLADLIKSSRPTERDFGLSREGLVPITSWGVGVLPLAHDSGTAMSLSPGFVAMILGWLNEKYDLFFDVGSFAAMENFASSLADLVYWVSEAKESHLRTTSHRFEEMRQRGIPLERFEIVINGKKPEEVPAKAVTRYFSEMKKRVTAWMPYDEAIPRATAHNRLYLLEAGHKDWLESGMTVLLGRTIEVTPRSKNWDIKSTSWSEFEGGKGEP